jgi:hypothetical protein
MSEPTALQWAVALGCTTPRRLAAEWSMESMSAYSAMKHAVSRGELTRLSSGVYGVPWFVDFGNAP